MKSESPGAPRHPFFAGCVLLTACSLAYPLGDYTSGSSPDPGGGGGETGVPVEGGSEGGVADDRPMIVYASAGGQLHLRRYDAASSTWSEPSDGPKLADGAIRAVVLRRSPIDGSRILAVYSVTPEEPQLGTLRVYEWSGSAFVEAWSDTNFGGRPGWRPFALAFTRATGRAIAVYGGGATGNPRMRVRTSSGWDPERNAFPTAPSDDWFDFLELTTRENSDDVALVYQTNETQIGAAKLAGDRFADATVLAPTAVGDRNQCVTGAFEQRSGDFVLGWVTNGGVEWSATPASQSRIASKMGTLGPAKYGRVTSAAQSGADRIAFAALQVDCTACEVATVSWNGSSFDPFDIVDTKGRTAFLDVPASLPSAIFWSADHALALYDRTSQGFAWTRWRGGAWERVNDYAPQTVISDKAGFLPFFAGNIPMALVQERRGVLSAVRYDGTGWVPTSPSPLALDLTDATKYEGLGVPMGADSP